MSITSLSGGEKKRLSIGLGMVSGRPDLHDKYGWRFTGKQYNLSYSMQNEVDHDGIVSDPYGMMNLSCRSGFLSGGSFWEVDDPIG